MVEWKEQVRAESEQSKRLALNFAFLQAVISPPEEPVEDW
jgi:hypothetical protein